MVMVPLLGMILALNGFIVVEELSQEAGDQNSENYRNKQRSMCISTCKFPHFICSANRVSFDVRKDLVLSKRVDKGKLIIVTKIRESTF